MSHSKDQKAKLKEADDQQVALQEATGYWLGKEKSDLEAQLDELDKKQADLQTQAWTPRQPQRPTSNRNCRPARQRLLT